MIIHIPLESICPNPWNTRQGEPDPEYIQALAKDIAENGLLQKPAGRLVGAEDRAPIPTGADLGAFEILALIEKGQVVVQIAFGHHRLAAFELLSMYRPDGYTVTPWEKMPVDIQPYSDEQMALLAWSENEKRRDVTPIERALAIQRRVEDFGWSHAEIADKLGISRPTVSNALRLLKLPENIQGALAEGKISERVGMALVSYFDLPEDMRNKASYGYWSTKEIVADALSGKSTSDDIRTRVDGILENKGKKLDQADFNLDKVFEVDGVRSAACRDCEQRFKERNICQDVNCYRIKSSFVMRNYLERAGQTCGIAIHDDLVVNFYEVTSFSRWGNVGHLDSVLKAKCENLRLVYDSNNPDEKERDRIKGFPHARIICQKREQFCNCLSGAKYALENKIDQGDQQAPSAYELKDLARIARAEKKEAKVEAKAILEDTAARIAAGLAWNNKSTWQQLLQKLEYGNTKELSDIWEIQVEIGRQIATRYLPYTIDSTKPVIANMNELLAKCELELLALPKEDLPILEDAEPAGMTLAEIFEEDEP